MITITVHCFSDALVQNGRAPNGKQKYLCQACKASDPSHGNYYSRVSILM